MIKNTIIALLGAALIQPFWSLATTWWGIVATYPMTVWVLYILIANTEEWLNEKRKDPESGNSQGET